MVFFFDIPPQSPTVRGYAAISGEGLRGATPEQLINLPPNFYREMGLEKVLTAQRLRGIDSIVNYLKRLARKKLEG